MPRKQQLPPGPGNYLQTHGITREEATSTKKSTSAMMGMNDACAYSQQHSSLTLVSPRNAQGKYIKRKKLQQNAAAGAASQPDKFQPTHL